MLALGCALLVVGIYAAYHNTFRVPFLFDDADSIEKNWTIQSLATALFPPTNSGVTVSGRPLLNLSLAVNYRWGGTDVFGYHLGNLLIHMAAALALFGVIRRTLQLPRLAGRYGTQATPLAWFAATLWAVHPLQTESVTYLIQRAESLVGLCYLLTLYAFIRAVENSSRVWAAAACLACFLGMAAKEVMVSAPLVMLLYDRTFVSGSFRASWQRHRRLHLGLAAGWLLLFALVISSGRRGTTVGFAAVSWWDYALTQTSGIIRYLQAAFWPVNLVFDYGAIVEKTPAVLIGSALLLLPLLVATMVALRKWPKAGFLAAAFFLVLAPTSSVVPVATQTLAEHRMYLPLAALVVGGTLLCHGMSRRFYGGVLLSLIVAAGTVTINRNTVYQTSLSIWEDTVRKVPDNVRALNNLGLFCLEADRVDEAIARLSEAVELVPRYAVAYSNLGRALIKKGTNETSPGRSTADLIKGIEFGRKPSGSDGNNRLLRNEKITAGLAMLEKATQLDPRNALFMANYADALLTVQAPEAAVPLLEQAVALEPENGDFHFNLANALARLDRDELAVEHFQAALRHQPNDVEVLTNYGSLLRRMGRLSESIDYLQTALRLKPEVARVHSNLGVSLLAHGRTAEGMRQLEEALRLDPNLAQARYNLSNALADTGRSDEAIVQLEALLRIAPPTAELLSNLGVLYSRVGRLEDAVTQTRRALELDPNYEAAQENLAKIIAYIRSHPR